MTKKFDGFSELDHYLHAVDWVINKRRKKASSFKRIVKARGGKCSICGLKYGLEFHHTEDDKEMDVSQCASYVEMKEEARKCILVCKRCHDQVCHRDDAAGQPEDDRSTTGLSGALKTILGGELD